MANDYDAQTAECFAVLEMLKTDLMNTAVELMNTTDKLLPSSGVQVDVEKIIADAHYDKSMTAGELYVPFMDTLLNACVLCGKATKAFQECDFQTAFVKLYYAATFNSHVQIAIRQQTFTRHVDHQRMVVLPAMQQSLAENEKKLQDLNASVAKLPQRIKDGMMQVGLATAKKVKSVTATNSVNTMHDNSGRREAYALMRDEWEYWLTDPGEFKSKKMFIAYLSEKFKATHKKTGVVKAIAHKTIETRILEWEKEKASQ